RPGEDLRRRPRRLGRGSRLRSHVFLLRGARRKLRGVRANIKTAEAPRSPRRKYQEILALLAPWRSISFAGPTCRSSFAAGMAIMPTIDWVALARRLCFRAPAIRRPKLPCCRHPQREPK